MSTAIDILTRDVIKLQHNREYKGKSLIDFPKSYCVIDIETTGLSPDWDEIIEISALKYEDDNLIDEFSSLLKPDDFSDEEPYLDEFITSLTGITDEMLSVSMDTPIVLKKFLDFVGNCILIGHNVNFDINFLYDKIEQYCNYYLSNDFIDTMRLSRKILPDLKHHRLSDLTEHYNILVENTHRAEDDALITQACYRHLFLDVADQYDNLNDFKKLFSKRHYDAKACGFQTKTEGVDTSHPLYGKVCVFTGTLEKMIRKEAMQIVADLGGINADGVTKKTNYLILGNNDYCTSIKGGKSSKQKKAEKLKLDGQDIEIIPENVFYDMIYCD